ncbi:ribosomal RNA large subunit methyltransferase j [Colletotrichum musicola]|uniref:rRNA methyltransferase 2, mitochondrial n=1 Tax=Colletotrichum musicola TaxID=2175873 RepID=A0A8H6JT86_9PEZI|nr:ribosomal RNA large subunit methyltransferase j [Colletotrichum musicola]
MSTAACSALLGAGERRFLVNSSVACILRRPIRPAGQTRTSSSSSRWKIRQGKDIFAREAKVQGLKSRAAFKLLEMDAKYKLFRKGQTVVDLVSLPLIEVDESGHVTRIQVAAERTKPHGQILGIDIIPAQPPKGVSTIQGNFLSPDVQGMVKEHLTRAKKQRVTRKLASVHPPDGDEVVLPSTDGDGVAAIFEYKPSYIDLERVSPEASETPGFATEGAETKDGRLVDVVLSDMSAPWDQTTGFNVNTLSNPYHRMMNTSGVAFRDHAGSMDLCGAALQFASDTLKKGGHFVCKFYQGSEDKVFEKKLRVLFAKVHREKPESSRSDSREAYFVALKRKGDVQIRVGENE